MADHYYIFVLSLFFSMALRQINTASIFLKDTSLIYRNCDSIKCPDSDKCPTDSFHPPIHEFNTQQNCCSQKSCTCKECPGRSAEDFLKCGKDSVLLLQEKGTGKPGKCCNQYKCGKKPICVDPSETVEYYPKKCVKCTCVWPYCKAIENCEEEEEIGHCFSDTNEGKKNGSKWTEENGCSECRCVNAQKNCTVSVCQASTCKNPKRIEGQCCPVCPEDLNPPPINNNNNNTKAFEKPTMNPIEAMTTTSSAPPTSDKSITSTMSTIIQQQERKELETISTTANEPIESAISKDLHKMASEKPTMNPIEARTITSSAPPTSDKSIPSTMSTIIQQQEQKELETISTTANEPIESTISTIYNWLVYIDVQDKILTTKIDMEVSSTTEELNDTTDAIYMEESSSTVGPINTANAIPTEMAEKESENLSDDMLVDSLDNTISPSTTSFPFFPSSSSTEEEGTEDFSSSSTTDGQSTISISISMPVSTSSPDFPTPESTSQHKDLVTMDRTSRTVEENPSNDTISHNVEENPTNDTISHNLLYSNDFKISNYWIGVSIVIIILVFVIIFVCIWCKFCANKNKIEEPEMPEKPDKQKQKKMENRIYTPVPSEHNLSQTTETSSLWFAQCGVESDKE